jgi:hypothetical protein
MYSTLSEAKFAQTSIWCTRRCRLRAVIDSFGIDEVVVTCWDNFAKVKVVGEHTLDYVKVTCVIIISQHHGPQVNIVRLILRAVDYDWTDQSVCVLCTVV